LNPSHPGNRLGANPQELAEEATEDMALVRALKEGEHTPRINREDVFRILERGE
jgi:hypothetical protein